MRNKRLIIVLTCAVVFGLLATMSVTRYLAIARGNTTTTSVVVAKVNIPLGTVIIAEQLTTIKFAPGTTPEGTFDSGDKVVGRVSATSIAALEPITQVKLAPEGAVGGLSAIIPAGYRAMTVKVDDVVGLAGFVNAGALVDIAVVITPQDNAGASRNPVSKIILQNIKVLASGQNLDQPKDKRDPESVKTVTVQVTPEQAEKLALASTEGKLRLVMRNAVDQTDEQTAGSTIKTMLSGERAMPQPDPAPVVVKPRTLAYVRRPRMETRRAATPAVTITVPAAPARVYSIEVLEGNKRRNVEFP